MILFSLFHNTVRIIARIMAPVMQPHSLVRVQHSTVLWIVVCVMSK